MCDVGQSDGQVLVRGREETQRVECDPWTGQTDELPRSTEPFKDRCRYCLRSAISVECDTRYIGRQVDAEGAQVNSGEVDAIEDVVNAGKSA